jgi:pimeloyl-ACP methyl ester carboxylesterase
MSSFSYNSVLIHVGNAYVAANLVVPDAPKGLVIFSNATVMGRLNQKNRYLAEMLNKQGMAVLLADLLTEEEDSHHNRHDIALLAKRLIAITKWATAQPHLKGLSHFYFGEGTGVGAALQAAAELKHHISGLVLRSGRTDLAIEAIPQIVSPTLLIVGAWDLFLLAVNQITFKSLNCQKKLVVVEGTTHRFEEPGKLEEVANLAADWFANSQFNEAISLRA